MTCWSRLKKGDRWLMQEGDCLLLDIICVCLETA